METQADKALEWNKALCSAPHHSSPWAKGDGEHCGGFLGRAVPRCGSLGQRAENLCLVSEAGGQSAGAGEMGKAQPAPG